MDLVLQAAKPMSSTGYATSPKKEITNKLNIITRSNELPVDPPCWGHS